MTYQIQTFNTIAPAGLAQFATDDYCVNGSSEPDGILLRSQDLTTYPFPPSLLAIARAGAGTNNIPLARCTEKGIVVFNTPGANANAVKELVLAALLLAVRPILAGTNWVQTLKKDAHPTEIVEQTKKQFVGHELEGKRLGVIGLGAIGSLVANDAYRLGMDVIGYDPYVSVSTAWTISRRVKRAQNLTELLSTCDFITLHLPLVEQTQPFVTAKRLAEMKPGTVLLNFARGELVDHEALLAALERKQLGGYLTDFVSPELLHHDQITLFPHLGASTVEAEINCARKAASTLKNYLTTGQIEHSVNFPSAELAFHSSHRLAIMHQNIPNMLGTISTIVSNQHENIDNLLNRSRGDVAYTLLDLTPSQATILPKLAETLRALPAVTRVRVIQNTEPEVPYG